DRANAIEPKCRGVDEQSVSSSSVVEQVEPSYARIPGGPNANEFRLRGVRIHLRPMPGATRETLVRALECHEALVVLGRVAAASDDPYAVPGRWLSIDVTSVGDGFVALVESDDHEAAAEALERAKRFRARP
ncbi:MAG TPA: hypothetical protein VIF62_00725, partial [Labilithrix sp.]